MSITEILTNIKPLSRKQIAWRAAQDVVDGSYVNLGIGIPTLIANYVVPDKEVVYHSENGLLGVGPPPKPGKEALDLVNASKQLVTLRAGGSYFNTAESFAMMRGKHLTSVFMGAFQVSEHGDLANWATNDKGLMPSIGGAMDLSVGCKKVGVLMNQLTQDGQLRILKECSYPLTAKGVVKRLYTDLAVIDVTPAGLVVREKIVNLEFAVLQQLSEAKLRLADDWCELVPPEIL